MPTFRNTLSIPKLRHIKFRSRGVTHKKECIRLIARYTIHLLTNTAYATARQTFHRSPPNKLFIYCCFLWRCISCSDHADSVKVYYGDHMCRIERIRLLATLFRWQSLDGFECREEVIVLGGVGGTVSRPILKVFIRHSQEGLGKTTDGLRSLRPVTRLTFEMDAPAWTA